MAEFQDPRLREAMQLIERAADRKEKSPGTCYECEFFEPFHRGSRTPSEYDMCGSPVVRAKFFDEARGFSNRDRWPTIRQERSSSGMCGPTGLFFRRRPAPEPQQSGEFSLPQLIVIGTLTFFACIVLIIATA